jgi:hypothetical protein
VNNGLTSAKYCGDVDWDYNGGHCYKFVSGVGLNWHEAEQECSGKFDEETHLASIRTKRELTFLHSMLAKAWIKNSTQPYVYMGKLPRLSNARFILHFFPGACSER